MKGFPSGDTVNELDRLAFLFMWRLRQEAVKAFQGLGLRLGQVAVLGFLDAGLSHPGEIADNLDYAPSLVSSLIASLEERGLIERRSDTSDKRKVVLELTREGQEILASLQQMWNDITKRYYAKLSPSELECLKRSYSILLEDE